MIYFPIYLWELSTYKLSQHLGSLPLSIVAIHQIQLTLMRYSDELCYQTQTLTVGAQFQLSKIATVTATIQSNLSYLILQNHQQERFVLVFFGIPKFLIDTPINYHRWIWGRTQPSWILLPNLTNNPQYYLPLKFKSFTRIKSMEIFKYQSHISKQLYLHSNLQFKFYVDTQYPITIYNARGQLVLGQDLSTGQYLDLSDNLELTEIYYISCNELISRKTQPMIQVSIGIYNRDRFLFSDQMIFRIAPLIFTPNNLSAETIYLAEQHGTQNNQSFIKDVTTILNKEHKHFVILRDPHISMYHRWVQDILKFGYFTDGNNTSQIILKGPRFTKSSNDDHDTSYIYQYFKDYPHYDFFHQTDKSLDAFGNVQIIPPIYPKYPFGRIIYGISTVNNISYNLVDLLESQQIQKPIHLDTGWLKVGHIDEIVSFIPDPNHKLGFRVLLASPLKFYQLISQLDPETIIFDCLNNYYIFQQSTNEFKHRFTQMYQENNKFVCLYRTQLKVKDILNWTEMIDNNRQYQAIMDRNQRVLLSKLKLTPDEVYHVPIYYWPQSLSIKAKSILPNMINNLYTDQFMLVPKPFGPKVKHQDLFEQYFRSIIPANVRIYFISNWDSYFLLDGDINCGTNVKRVPFDQPWWSHMPDSSYNF